MSKLASLSNLQLLLRIVEAVRHCPRCFPQDGLSYVIAFSPHQDCQECGGTGKVPILDPKLMRLPCPMLYERPLWASMQTTHELQGINCECGGRNWVPNPDAWDMRKALHLAGFYLREESIFVPMEELPWGAACWPKTRTRSNVWATDWAWAADPEWVRLLAVAKAFGI